MKYRKKPVVVEAKRFDGSWESRRTIVAWAEGAVIGYDDDGHYLSIRTLEGQMRANPGDWIIKGVAGEFYPCKPDIFAATYEPTDGGNASDAGGAS